MFKKITYCFFIVLLLCSVFVTGICASEQVSDESLVYADKSTTVGDSEGDERIELFAAPNGYTIYISKTSIYEGESVRIWYETKNGASCTAKLRSNFYSDGEWHRSWYWELGEGSTSWTLTSGNGSLNDYTFNGTGEWKFYLELSNSSGSYNGSLTNGCISLSIRAKISYNANGGSGAPSYQTKYDEEDLTLSSTIPTRFKYKFIGWSTSSAASSVDYYPKDTYTGWHNVTLYAVWESYDTLSGNYDTDSTRIRVGGTMGYFQFTPSVSGTYVFQSTNSSGDTKGYLYSSGGSEKTSDDDGGDGYNFKISYYLNGGTTYYYGVKWYDSSGTGYIYVDLRRQYDITYNPNAGTGGPSVQTKLHGKNLILSSSVPARTGYTFVGWDTSSTATTATYTAGASCSLNADSTLYAIWKAEGTCGDSCTWILDNAGTLTISGVGNMADYTDVSSVPWSSIRGDIKKIVVSEGITSIGDNCFNLCTAATTISLPSTLTSIGESSFAYTPITTISLSEGVTSIGNSAFEGCSQLTSIVLPSTLTQIGSSAFINCSLLNNVCIPSGVTAISDYCFAECAALKNITIPFSVTEIKDYAFCMTTVEAISYGGSPTHWNKIAIGTENNSLASATKTYGVEDFTVTYAATTNGACSADKTTEQVPNGEKADLSVVAKRASTPSSGPIGTEKDVAWEFLGWNTNQNATEALEEVIVTSDVTLYPIFKKELTFNFYHANNELLESKTVAIYNADNYATFVVPTFNSYLDWEPVEWCNDMYYSETSDPVSMYAMGVETNFRFSVDLYARYKRTTTVSYEVGEYTGTFEPETFTQYYYGSGQKTSGTVFMPEVVVPIGEPLFYGWAKNSIDGDVFQGGDRMTVSEDTVLHALWQERTTSPTITVSDNNGLQTVSMSCSMDGATIYYTTDGTKPTPDSNLYTKAITITGNEDMTFKAMAINDGYAYSKAVTKDVILNTVSTPISSILPGYVKKNSVVSLSTGTPGATIYYTTDGTVPTRESNVYSSPFTITETMEICTLSVKDGMKDSPATMFKYTVIDDSTPYINIVTTLNDDNTLTATVNITENSKSAGGSFNLIYDNSVLEIVDVNKGNYIKYANPYIKKDYNDNAIRVVWAGVEELEGGGEILTATFNLLSTTKEQTLLSIEKAKLSDADANKLTVQSSDAIVLLSSSNTQYFDEYKTETTVGTDKKSLVVNLVERAEENGCIITAIYSNDGRLVQLKSTDITTVQDTYTIPLDTALENKQKIKVFVWSSLSKLKPISTAEEFIYE